MHLESIAIRNFRSLREVRLEGLDRMNVLIGRNNAGKSAVLNALQLLTSHIRGEAEQDPDLSAMAPIDQPNLRPELDLTFVLSEVERRGVLEPLKEFGGWSAAQLDDLIASPLFRRLATLFETGRGQGDSFHAVRIETTGRDGVPLLIGNVPPISDRPSNPAHRFVNLESALVDRRSLDAVGIGLRDGLAARDVHMRADLVREFPRYAAQSPSFWPLHLLVEFFADTYFCSPFRRSAEMGEAEEAKTLRSDASNLVEVLTTLRNGHPNLFSQIEEIVGELLPDRGALLTPYRAKQVFVAFEDERGQIALHHMGGGTEQVLVVATAIVLGTGRGLLAIDEPELHIHAGVQRALVQRLLAHQRQILVSTHSSVFVNLNEARVYRVALQSGVTSITSVSEPQELGTVLEDAGIRRSDVLMSDKVIFVEGTSDEQVLRALADRLGLGETHGLSFVAMRGGEFALRYAPVRSELLKEISKGLPVPHLFVVDRDERPDAEVSRLRDLLGKRVHVLERREIENYLLVPRALVAVLHERLASHERSSEADALTAAAVARRIAERADQLYGVVLLKRIRAELAGVVGGLLPRERAETLARRAQDEELAEHVVAAVTAHVGDFAQAERIRSVVEEQRDRLDSQWADPALRLTIAPGAELLDAVFGLAGLRYRRESDAAAIATELQADEIADELRELLLRAFRV